MMRTYTLAVALLVLTFSGAAFAADAKEPKGPIITLKEEQYQFGEVLQGTTAEHEFEITNTGDAELVIERIAPS
jgi:hypothetical protein